MGRNPQIDRSARKLGQCWGSRVCYVSVGQFLAEGIRRDPLVSETMGDLRKCGACVCVWLERCVGTLVEKQLEKASCCILLT